MAAQNHRLAATRQRDDQILHLAAANRIQAGSRLVEDHQVGIVDERLRQPDAPLHALGKFADGARLCFAETDHFQQLFRAVVALVFREMKQIPEEIQRLARVEIAIQIRFLRQIADA